MMDQDIIILLKAHKEEALHEIKESYHALFLYILSQKGFSHEDIEECINDIYLEIWNSKDRFDESKSSLKTFLCAIARHISYHCYRKNNNEQKHRMNTDINHIAKKETYSEIEKQLLASIIQSLSRQEKDLFYRKYYYMQSTLQMATELCMSQKAIESRLYRLRKKMQEQWKEANL